MADEPPIDEETTVDPDDRVAVRRQLEQFAGTDRIAESVDGTLVAEFSGSTQFAVGPDGRVHSGMPLHGFDGPAEKLRFDHEAGEIHVSANGGAVEYTFRRPSR